MLQGMTGYSQAQGVVAGIKIGVELRSYNHRYLDIVINAPNGFSVLEDKIRSVIKRNFTRGRVLLNIQLSHHPGGEIVINEELIKDYLYNIRRVSKKFKIREDLSIRDFINLPGVVSLSRPQTLKQNYWSGLEKLLWKVIAQLKNMRLSEGRSTFKDLMFRSKLILAQTDAIKKNVRLIIARKKAQLEQEEFSAYLKTTDISEELVRLSAHLKNFKSLLINPRLDAKGKELDFIAQELQREANTIAAKSQDYPISKCVVKIKADIEKIREQVQNIQ